MIPLSRTGCPCGRRHGVNVTTFTDKNTISIKENKYAILDYDMDWILEYTGWGWGTPEDLEKEYMYYGKYYDLSPAFPAHYVVINKDLPDIVRSACVASVLYLEIFGADYGEKVLQDWVDQFYTGLGDFDVKTDGV